MNWMTILYQIPREPQKNRMAVWRKLKSIVALNVLQSIWILPESKDAEAEFEKLAKQINQSGGKSISCVTVIQDEAQNQRLIDGFNKEREFDYNEILEKCDDLEREIQRETERENFTYAEVDENEHELEKLNIWFKKIVQKDYFGCPHKTEVMERLEKCMSLLNQFSHEVFSRDEKENEDNHSF
ncbi:MAG: Chromate resistance protein ChrB [Bacillota bacterium]